MHNLHNLASYYRKNIIYAPKFHSTSAVPILSEFHPELLQKDLVVPVPQLLAGYLMSVPPENPH
jgi:hypothetical protein